MAGRAYQEKRGNINLFPVPQGWVAKRHEYDGASGFEAISFVNGTDFASSTKIVISYAGTDELVDWFANGGLAFGFAADQLKQAALYYLQVKELNQDATITFTGHSLGGGLAALMGVLFDEQTITFDQAPFAAAASASVRDSLVIWLNGQGYDQARLEALAPELLSYGGSGERIGNVTGLFVEGEVLQYLPFSTIGDQDSLSHGPYSHPSIDLHSMALLTAFLQSEQASADGGNPQQTLSEVSKKITDLLGMLFNSELYARETDPTNTTQVNFLEHLIQHQEGLDPSVANDGDAMLARFTSDLWKIAQGGGLTISHDELTKALTAFAMQKYYEEPASGADHGQELFSEVTGGIRFNRADVADTLDTAIGYNKYFIYYLATMPQDEREAILQKLPNLLDWYIQAGSEGMTASAGNERAFMLGGSGSDHLTGGDNNWQWRMAA